MGRAERERCRGLHRPDEVVCLFIGESPPNGGTFFYSANSNLYEATREAFYDAIPATRQGNFLERFRDCGCYLEDLCLDPVNQWNLRDPRRLRARKSGENLLARRMKDLSVLQVYVVMKDIEENARRALEEAGLADVSVEVFPFPRDPNGRAKYRSLLSRSLKRLLAEGILRCGARKRSKEV